METGNTYYEYETFSYTTAAGTYISNKATRSYYNFIMEINDELSKVRFKNDVTDMWTEWMEYSFSKNEYEIVILKLDDDLFYTYQQMGY
jgi:hypothetical protein